MPDKPQPQLYGNPARIKNPPLAEDFALASRVAECASALNSAMLDAYQSGCAIELDQQTVTIHGRHPRGCPVLLPAVLRHIKPGGD